MSRTLQPNGIGPHNVHPVMANLEYRITTGGNHSTQIAQYIFMGDGSLGMEVGGLFGLIVLAAMIWALINVFQSSASTGAKVIWTLLIVVLPMIGFLLWLIAGPRK